MWDTVIEQKTRHLSHEMPCTACGHAPHTFLPCSDTCDCTPPSVPGAPRVARSTSSSTEDDGAANPLATRRRVSADSRA